MGFNYLINLYFIYQYSSRLETSKKISTNTYLYLYLFFIKGTFNGKPADYIFCLFFLWICNVIAGSILSLYVLMDAMILSVMYIWCQLNKEAMMSFWFGMQFKAMYMPWVIMLFNWIVSGSYVN
jgi:derlin-1